MTAPRTAQDQHLRDLATFRLVRTADREYAQPADVDALAHGVNLAHRTQPAPHTETTSTEADPPCRRRGVGGGPRALPS